LEIQIYSILTSVGAVKSGNVEIVQILLYRSTTFKHLNQNNESVYHLAVKTGNPDMLAALVGSQARQHQHNKDILKTKNGEGFTALHLAGNVIHGFCHYYSFDQSYNSEQLFGSINFFIVGRNQYKMVEMLVTLGAPVEVTSNRHETPLFIAATNGYADIAELLLKNKASVNHKNSSNDTPLNIALHNKYVIICKLFKVI
jgi:ankyrin repeat protein